MLADRQGSAAGRGGQALRERTAAIAAAGLVAGGIGLALLYSRPSVPGAAPAKAETGRDTAVLQLPALNSNLLRQIAPDQALQLNAERPFSARPDSPAAAFLAAGAKTDDLARAIECLAQTIYYEAGGEGPDGERAVAQVVLNRVRRPGYPSSVCGTVYQGSQRATGCQFTFTCDGSLRRIPGGALWSRAQRIAREAIVSGTVFAPVGHATHYHADYVLPYWADSLEKTIQIGRHIFYRLKGSAGSARAFSQRYASVEPVPQSPTAAAVAADAIAEALADAAPPVSDLGALAGAKVPESPLPDRVPVKADEGLGVLLMPAAPVKKAIAVAEGCTESKDARQSKPKAADDLRSGGTADAC